MYQHIDLMAAQSLARERERDLQDALRRRQPGAGRTAAPAAAPNVRRHRLHDLLVRAHLAQAPVH